MSFSKALAVADPAWKVGGGGGGGGLKRGGADCRRSHPGEGARGGHPSRPARGYGRALCYFYTEILVLSPKTPMQVCYEFLIWGGGGGAIAPPSPPPGSATALG